MINYFLSRAPGDRALMFDQKTRCFLSKANGTEQTSKNSFHARDRETRRTCGSGALFSSCPRSSSCGAKFGGKHDSFQYWQHVKHGEQISFLA